MRHKCYVVREQRPSAAYLDVSPTGVVTSPHSWVEVRCSCGWTEDGLRPVVVETAQQHVQENDTEWKP